MVWNVIFLIVMLVELLMFLLLPGGYWTLGAAAFLLTVLGWLLGFVPHKPASSRGLWAFATFGLVTAVLVATITPLFGFLTVPNFASETLFVYLGNRLTVAAVGGVVALVTTPIFFCIVGYFSSIYVLGMHEDLGFRTAFKSYIFLIFNITLPWLLVENGKVEEIRKQGYSDEWLSRGKIIVKPGNAIVTEKGGRITGIHGPGVVTTVKSERIRTIFDLRPQFMVHTLKNVITADQIPLEIEFGVGYRLTPAENPDSATVLKEKNFGAFAVEEETLKKAAFNGTAGGWTGFGANVPVGQLRDQIMAHTFNELFTIEGNPSDIKVKANERKIKQIEKAIMEAVNSFTDKGMGVTITTVDISTISLPEDMQEAVHTRIKALAEAEAIGRIEEKRNEARSQLVTKILDSISTGTGNRIGPDELELAAVFAQISRRALTDDVLGHQYIDMLKAIATGDAMKIFNVTPSPATVEPEHVLESHRGNGRRKNGKD